MDKKGQLSIINVFMWIILVIIGGIFTPILAEQAEVVYNSTNNTATQLISYAIVPFFWLGVLITFFVYIAPIRVREY